MAHGPEVASATRSNEHAFIRGADMSIPFSGTFGRSGGVASAIAREVRLLNLKAAQRVVIAFDPFHDKIKHTRDFAHFITSRKIQNANPSCLIKTEIFCNRGEPTVTLKILPEFIDKLGSNEIVVKTGNLTCLELFQIVNKYVTPLAPKEEKVTLVGKARKFGKK